jgi:hypothetical protein
MVADALDVSPMNEEEKTDADVYARELLLMIYSGLRKYSIVGCAYGHVGGCHDGGGRLSGEGRHC